MHKSRPNQTIFKVKTGKLKTEKIRGIQGFTNIITSTVPCTKLPCVQLEIALALEYETQYVLGLPYLLLRANHSQLKYEGRYRLGNPQDIRDVLPTRFGWKANVFGDAIALANTNNAAATRPVARGLVDSTSASRATSAGRLSSSVARSPTVKGATPCVRWQ